MGSKFAPSFANLYVGLFESLFITNEHKWKENIVLYKRYIDDLLFIWQGSAIDFEDFKIYLNENDWGLNFSGVINPVSVDYLDITLFHDRDKICTKN